MTFSPAEITAMAEKMAICFSADSFEFTNDGLLAFANLVAEKAAAKEREACARIAKSYVDKEWPGDDLSVQAANTAAAIRARCQKEAV